MSRPLAWRLALTGTALLLMGVRWPPGVVERWYSRFAYPPVQSAVTGLSNLVPFAMFDVMIGAALAGLAWGLATIVGSGRGERWRVLRRTMMNVVAAAAALYVAFYACWGLNYQREPVTAWLDFAESRVTPVRAGELADQIVAALVRLRGVAPPASSTDSRQDVARTLAPAFADAVHSLGLTRDVRPGRPKVSLLDPYFTRAGVSGMTDPFFLETLAASNLLPIEEPAVVAHEWAHLAGVARESEASFVGWLTCIHADPWAQDSGWLDLLMRVAGSLDADQRRSMAAGLPARVVSDIRSIQQRNQRDQVRLVSLVAWRTYDSYLKTNRVASGVANYNEVVRLVLGVRFESDWMPVRKK